MTLLQNAPDGFATALLHVDALPSTVLETVLGGCIDFVGYRTALLPSPDQLYDSLVAEGISSPPDRPSLSSAINALVFIIRNAAQGVPAANGDEKERIRPSGKELLKQLALSTPLQDTSREAIARAWHQHGAALVADSDISALLSVGKLIDWDWKIGVTTASSTCTHINTPYVALKITVSNECGSVNRHSFEMGLPEFQMFVGKLKDALSAVEAV